MIHGSGSIAYNLLGFHVMLVVKNPWANSGDPRDLHLIRVGKIPWRRKWHLTPLFLHRKSHGRGDWQNAVHGAVKSPTYMSN